MMGNPSPTPPSVAAELVLTPLSPDKASTDGQWKRKKGPAPPRPIPQKRQVKKLPRKAVNTELQDIEIKQQELERQGVRLEKTIREVCEKNDQERVEAGLENKDRESLGPEVEDLIVQLFDLVNEKNDLYRRQTELMYMKRDHRLEEEHADIEHQVRFCAFGQILVSLLSSYFSRFVS
jgi:predicted  nucleic acid-binding Zn-ribbon protein